MLGFGILVVRTVRDAIAPERLGQQSIKPELCRVSELVNPDGHALVAGCRLRSICPEQTIPPWQIETEIAVGLEWQDRMVDPMHVWCDDKPTQNAIDGKRDPQIRVIEH